MLNIEELKELVNPILESAVESAFYDGTEDIIQTIINDYMGMEEPKENEWETKYNDLKNKYISRFFGEEEKEEKVEEEEIKEDNETKIEDTKIDDIFEEKKED